VRDVIRRHGIRRILGFGALLMVGAFVLIQLVPYGRDHTNPAATAEPRWDTPRTRALAKAACFDCHSNLTKWPWYTNVAPASWLVQKDVDDGRSVLNFSTWDRRRGEPGDIVEQVQSGEMPPLKYKLIHGAARLSSAEQRDLVNGLRATLAAGGSSAPGR